MNLCQVCVLAMVAMALPIERTYAASSIARQSRQDSLIRRNDETMETIYRIKRAPLGKLALLGGAAILGKKALLLGGAAVGAKALVGAGLIGAGLYKAKHYGGGGGGYGYGYGYDHGYDHSYGHGYGANYEHAPSIYVKSSWY